MLQIPFHKSRLTRIALACFVGGMLGLPAAAQVINYTNGTDNASPILLTGNQKQLQVLAGSATQSGPISESGGSFGFEKIGSGTLSLTGVNTYSGGTTISGGALVVGGDALLGASGGAVTLNGGTLQFGGGVSARNYLVQAAGGTISAGDPSVVAPGNQTTLAGTISGAGGLMFTGLGGFTLTGNNNYAGGTTIYEGAILVGNGGTTGLIVGNVVAGVATANAGINFYRSDDITFSGNISGLGYVAQYGTGTLTLTGNNTYAAYTTALSGRLAFASDANVGTGDIKIYGGTVQYNASFTSALNYQLSGGAIDTNGNLVTLSGNVLTMSGTNVAAGYGGLTKIGAGTLILAGSDTYQGPTLISAGALQIGNGGTTGYVGTNASIINNAALIFDRSDSVGFGGVISGTGSLTQSGSGTLLLTGVNTYTGGTTITGGTLKLGSGGGLASTGSLAIIGGPGNPTFDVNGQAATVGALSGSGGMILLGAGSLTTNSSANTSLASIISGGGSLIKAGTGTLSLTGTNTYSGGTVINAGTLMVLGSITASTVTIQSGGALNGLGSVGAVTVQSGGRLAPGNPLADPMSGNSVGALAVNGNLVLASGATYGTVLGYSSNAGWTFANTSISGSASIAGALSLEFPGYSGAFARGQQYTLISSSGTLTGSFSSISAPGLSGTGFHVGSLSYDAHDVYLSLVRDTFVWSAAPVSSDWSDNSNWQNGAVPEFDVAHFGSTNRPVITIGPFAAAGVTSLTFEAGAPAYRVTIANPASVPVPSGFVFVPDPPCVGICLGNAPTEVVNLYGGIVDNSSNPPDILVGGVFDRSYLIFVSGGNAADARITAAAFGSVIFEGIADAGPAAKLSTLSGGIFDFSGTSGSNADNKVSAGSIAGAGNFILGINNLTVGALNTSTEVSGVISGDGSLTKVGTGSLTLSGTNSYAGVTTITGGTLQIGNGGTGGSISNDVINNAELVFNRSDAVTFANIISGTGALVKLGAGSLTLSGVNTYAGGTAVTAGTLNVIGTIASSAVTVQTGATLTGSGKVAAAAVASGGTLTPGLGTLSVSGNLALASGATYLDAVTPNSAGLTSVGGIASIGGNFNASVSAGAYAVGQRFTVLTAGGGVSGTFAALNGIPVFVKGRLSYDPNNVYLNLDPVALASSLPDVAAHQSSSATAIDAAVAGGNIPGGGFAALYSLTGAALKSAINQISGQAAPNVSNAVGQGFLSFLSMTGQDSGDTGSFAPGSAYGAADAPHRAQLAPGVARVWSAVYGGHVGLSADATSGAASLSSSNVGLIGGVDMEVDDSFLIGLTAGLGRQSFTSGNGTGQSDDVMIGAYARKNIGPLTISGAFGYGRHQITTLRVVTVSGTDVLQSKQHADDFGGRLEAGWRTAPDDRYAIIPYVAVAAESLQTPAYGETALSGASTFALSYASRATSLGRSELGARLARAYETDNGSLSANLQAAWAHQLDDAPLTQATFQSLPGASFVVAGVRPASDTALFGGGIEIQNRSGLFFGAKAEAQLGSRTTIVGGIGNVGWHW